MKDPAEIARRLDELQQKIGIAFKSPALLQEALSHSSFANENPTISPHDNERLEYLGDAVLQLISAEFLFRGRPGAAEGEMTQVRSSMVNTQALAALSEDLGMGEFLLLGKGIARGGGRNLRSLLANAFEAVLGAIFLDQGYDAAYHYCMERFRALPDAEVPENFKGRLQHLVQDRFGVTPVYDAIGARAQSGRVREYTAVVYAGGDPLGTGHGRTKQVAEQTAAQEAIRKLTGDAAVPAGRPAELPDAVRKDLEVEDVLAALAAVEEVEPSPADEAPVSEAPIAELSEEPPQAASAEELQVAVPAEEPQAEAPLEEAVLEERCARRSRTAREALEEAAPEQAPVEEAALEEAPVEEAALEEAPVAEPPSEPSGGGWRSRREVAERAAAERRRPRPEPSPAPAAASAGETEPVVVAEAPAAPPPPKIAPGRQFGAPAAEIEVEVVTGPPEVERLVAAPATSRIPAESASAVTPPRQFGQPVAEITPEPEPPPTPRRRASRTTRSSRTSAASGPATVPGETTQSEAAAKPAPRRRAPRKTAAATEVPPPAAAAADLPPPGDTDTGTDAGAKPEPEAPKPARRRSTRAKKTADATSAAEPTPAPSQPELEPPAAPRRRTTRRRPAAEPTGTD